MAKAWYRRTIGTVAGLAAMLAAGQLAGARAAEKTHVAVFLNGTLGDKSFYDSAARGLARAKTELGVEGRVIEAGYDPTRWESTLIDVADSGTYDTVVLMTYDMTAPLQKIAPQYPNIKFIILDSAVDYAKCPCKNVYSAVFRQNEGAYLAGILAARLVQQKAGGLAADAKLGTVGGMDLPVINDFIIGFEGGARSVAPSIGLIRQYANSFGDPATGKEVAKAEFGQGAGIVFQVAGATGEGVIEAAREAGRYVIGVDSDQAMLYATSSPQTAQHIVTSVMKNVDNVVVRSLKLELDGKLPFGRSEALGLAEGGIGLADNQYTDALVPPAVLEEVRKAQAGIIAGTIKVPSAF